MNEAQMMVDILDIMASLKRGFSVADLMVQLTTLYAPRGGQPDQAILEKILNEQTEQGHLKTFKIGILPSWKITPEGEEFFENF